ncbi:MAG: hypothetical protein QMD23_08005 [Candidatus Bathyarchaeia archaeon]|nr:hypothetical protein [Candidatus Bathyarchaeia archaeon]
MVFILSLLAVASVAFATMVIKTQWDIRSQLQVLGYELKVYNVDGTECTYIDWGPLRQGNSSYHDIIAENTGDHFLNLMMNTTLDSSVGTVSWNYSGILDAKDSTALRLTLNISITISGWVTG